MDSGNHQRRLPAVDCGAVFGLDEKIFHHRGHRGYTEAARPSSGISRMRNGFRKSPAETTGSGLRRSIRFRRENLSPQRAQRLHRGRKTIEWYLAHEKWIQEITGGDYRQWIAAQYSV